MAGFYPDVPGPRMAYHRDGSVAFRSFGATVTLYTTAQAQELNDEDEVEVVETTGNYCGVIFPELRDLNGIFIHTSFIGESKINDLGWSADTTTGADGTWTKIGDAIPHRANSTTSPYYRTEIYALAVTGAKAIRFQTASYNTVRLRTLHLYGKPSTGATRYLVLTDTAGTEVGGAYFDLGDDPRGGSEDRQFKVKNGHPTLTANSVVVSFGVLFDKSPSFADDYTFSTDGTAFAASINVGNLAPGASTSNLHVRRTTPANAALGLETGWIQAAAGSWT